MISAKTRVGDVTGTETNRDLAARHRSTELESCDRVWCDGARRGMVWVGFGWGRDGVRWGEVV